MSGFKHNVALQITSGAAFGRELGITARLNRAEAAIGVVKDPVTQLAAYKAAMEAEEKKAHNEYEGAKAFMETLGVALPTEVEESLARGLAVNYLEAQVAILDAKYPFINDNSVMLSAAARTPIHAPSRAARAPPKPRRKARK